MLGVTKVVGILMVTHFRFVVASSCSCLGIHQRLGDKLFSLDSIINNGLDATYSSVMRAFRGLRSTVTIACMGSKLALVLRSDLLRLIERPRH